MIEKAFGLQQAAYNAVYNDETRMLAGQILFNHVSMTQEEMQQAIFELLAHLSSIATFEAVCVLLDEEQQNELASTIDMLQNVGE